mmetsp:Transcript_29671/g.83668  ORF Transcript_29671/g.83668 Transcript_29671/m.83668 type:complete len:223 (-) Transcript_29671:108-776(-)
MGGATGEGQQLVADRLSRDGIDLAGVLHQPGPGPPWVRHPLRLLFSVEWLVHWPEGVVEGVALAGGLRHHIHLRHGVGLPVHCKVQPRTEHVLVDLSVDPRGHHDTPAWLLLALGEEVGGELPAETDLEVDGSVLAQVPVEQVLVVDHRGNGAQHKLAGPPGFSVAVAVLEVLPQDAVVDLMHADSLLDGEGLALRVVQHSVEVVDVAQAVAAELKGVSAEA